MILLGTIVNVVAIIIGSMIGKVLPRIKDEMSQTVNQAIGLAVAVLGMMMAFKSEHFLLVIFSLVVGSVIGEWMQIEERLNRMGKWLEKKVGGKGESGSIATSFVASTLLYCVGAMAILGALDSGLRNQHDILYTKAMLDGFTAIIFASTIGIGVIFSAIPVFLYQAAIALSAAWLVQFMSDDLLQLTIQELTAVGGIMIIAIAFNLMQVKKMKVGNMLPAIPIVWIAVPLMEWGKPLLDEFFGAFM